MITVYTTGPACYKCKLTKDALSKAGVEYTELPADQAPADVAAGHMVAPIVVDNLTGAVWSDFRRDLIKAAIEARA
ncbi:NrdH-like glutaredoxin [Mycobacterium phage Chris]|uniref:NrdH-like glutaredoxin n=1 Tax=Mycobacterium phage Chris TaxID=2725626 RepID=A0A6M3T8V5_9CAUD|nr:NrdH-like glutaredoxin [Mycobacterium phage Chris]QJD50471.1 NrdH-like glutaredoxin [Mycobacterium phage Chris]